MMLVGDVTNCVCILIDDLVDTGNTVRLSGSHSTPQQLTSADNPRGKATQKGGCNGHLRSSHPRRLERRCHRPHQAEPDRQVGHHQQRSAGQEPGPPRSKDRRPRRLPDAGRGHP